MTQKIKTAWMWAEDVELRGLEFDPDKKRLAWFDQAGCHCGDATDYQSLESYRTDGVPGWIGDLPADVASELDESIAHHS